MNKKSTPRLALLVTATVLLFACSGCQTSKPASSLPGARHVVLVLPSTSYNSFLTEGVVPPLPPGASQWWALSADWRLLHKEQVESATSVGEPDRPSVFVEGGAFRRVSPGDRITGPVEVVTDAWLHAIARIRIRPVQ